MLLERVEVIAVHGASRCRLLGQVRYDDGSREELWFEFPAEAAPLLNRSGDPWLVALAPLAMSLREALRIPMPVDPVLQSGILRIAEQWRAWNPGLGSLDLGVIPEAPGVRATGPRIASLFSGGVDSWHTLLANHADADAGVVPRIDTLVLVHGADLALDNASAFLKVEAEVAAAAAEHHCALLSIATNLRATRWGTMDWGLLSHGACFAAIAHATGVIGTCFVPSTVTSDFTGAWGSHPLTDRWFSSTATQIVHHAAELDRMEKIARLCETPEVLDRLRVCWRSGTEANCGQCGKCVRTMIGLELRGALKTCRAFPPGPLDPRVVSRLQVDTPLRRHQLAQMVLAAERAGRAELARALKAAGRRAAWLGPVEALLSRLSQGGVRGSSRLRALVGRGLVRE